MLRYPLTNFETQKHEMVLLNLMVYIQEIIFSKIKDGAYIINLDEYKSIRTHWIALYVNAKNVT